MQYRVNTPRSWTATVGLGFPEGEIVGIGVTLLICTLLYVIPRTSILGAVLLTGYLGGAIASKVRIHAPLFRHLLRSRLRRLRVGWTLAARAAPAGGVSSAPVSQQRRQRAAEQGGGAEARTQV